VTIPVFGNGDCVEAEDLVARSRATGVAGVLVGRGVLRNPWIFAQAAALASGVSGPTVTLEERGRFLLDYIDLLTDDARDEPEGFRHVAGAALPGPTTSPARGRERWVINKLRALCAWYTRGLDGGSQLRATVNQTASLPDLRRAILAFFFR